MKYECPTLKYNHEILIIIKYLCSFPDATAPNLQWDKLKEDFIECIILQKLKCLLCVLMIVKLATGLVWPELFFSKHLSLLVNKQNIFGLSIVLELKVENSTILTFNVIFLCQKSTEAFSIFFSLKNIKEGEQLLIL